jgi:hypothetical protein
MFESGPFHHPFIRALYGRCVRLPRIPSSGVLLLVAAAFAALVSTAAAVTVPRPDDFVESQPVALPEYVPRLDHVVVVMMENKDIGDVVGSRSAQVFDRLLRQGAAITNYRGITHPSLPNYLALVSGSTHGITTDCTSCSVIGPSLASTLPSGAWKTYAEDLPRRGWTGPRSGAYAKKHNPFVYFRAVARNRSLLDRAIVPLGEFSRDVERHALPRFALVVPNQCHDMHDCSVSTGDAWLGGFLTPLVQSPDLRHSVVFVVFDEGTEANHVPALAIGPAVRAGSTFSRPTNHYGLLRTIEQGLGLPLLGHSRNAQAIGGIWRARA